LRKKLNNGEKTMIKVIQWGDAECLVMVGDYEFPIPKMVGEEIEKINSKVKHLEQSLAKVGGKL